MGTTNYYNTFIEVADDCPVDEAEVPPERSRKTKVRMQYELISENPYEYTSDDLVFHKEKKSGKLISPKGGLASGRPPLENDTAGASTTMRTAKWQFMGLNRMSINSLQRMRTWST